MNSRSDHVEFNADQRYPQSNMAEPATANAGSSRPSGEMSSFIADIEHLITSMTPLTGDDLAKAKAKLSERVAAAKASATEMRDQVADRARKTANSTDHYVHQRPWQAVGIGTVVGLIIGMAFARRK